MTVADGLAISGAGGTQLSLYDELIVNREFARRAQEFSCARGFPAHAAWRLVLYFQLVSETFCAFVFESPLDSGNLFSLRCGRALYWSWDAFECALLYLFFLVSFFFSADLMRLQ